MARLRARKEFLGVIGVVVAIAAGATLPIVLSATAGAHSPGSAPSPAPVAACSPPINAANQPVANFSPPFCTPAITAVPNTGLGDGQTIKVTGTGYSANALIGMVECGAGATGPSGCDLSTLLELVSDGNGAFTTPYTVTRIIETNPKGNKEKTLDCAKQSCFLGAADINNFSVAAFTPLSFDPSLPLELTATLSHTGGAHAKSGVADISGTVSCTHPLTVEIDVQLEQIYGRFVFRSEAYAIMSCKGTKTWTVHVPPGNGTYAPGVATATVNVQAETGTSYRDISLKGKVHLTAAGK